MGALHLAHQFWEGRGGRGGGLSRCGCRDGETLSTCPWSCIGEGYTGRLGGPPAPSFGHQRSPFHAIITKYIDVLEIDTERCRRPDLGIAKQSEWTGRKLSLPQPQTLLEQHCQWQIEGGYLLGGH